MSTRLNEHYQHRATGNQRRASWALLSVLPLNDNVPIGIVRAAEGWAARGLMPTEGSAHPITDLGEPPRILAQSIAP
ncbi:hypothetical protein QM646_01855 [Rhodococcus erythropolis]|nr:hypothetical protein [Rhodococcus erythropolis]